MVRIFFFLFVLFLSGLAASLLYFSGHSFETTLSILGSYAADGEVDGLTQQMHASLSKALLILGIISAACATVLLIKSRSVIYLGSRVSAGVIRYLKEQYSSLAQYLHSENLYYLLTLLFLLILGSFLRLKYIGRAIYYDEAYTYLSYVSRNPLLALSNYSEPNNHLLQTFLNVLSDRVFGSSLFSLRLPALLQGLALIPLTFYCSRKYLGVTAALLATALVSTNPALIQFSTMARGYSLLCLLSVLLLSMHHQISVGKTASWYFCFGAISALGLWTVPVFIYAIIPIGVFGLILQLQKSKERPLKIFRNYSIAAVSCVGLTLVFYLPAILRSGFKQIIFNEHISSIPWSEFSNGLPFFFYWTIESWFRGIYPALMLLILAGFFFFVIRKQESTRLRSLVAIAFTSVLLALVTQRVLPFRRVWLMYLPVILIISAAGLQQILSTLTTIGKIERFSNLLTNILALAIAIFSSASLLLYHQDGFRDDQGTLIEAKKIVWGNEFNKRDKILAVAPDDAPLRYEAKLKDVKLLALFDSIEEVRGDLYVVENKRANFKRNGEPSWIYLPEIFASRGVNPRYVKNLELLKDYGSSKLYVLRDAGARSALFE